MTTERTSGFHSQTRRTATDDAPWSFLFVTAVSILVCAVELSGRRQETL